MTGSRVVRPVHPVPVALAGPHVGEMAVPHEIGLLAEPDPMLGALVIEEAQVDRLGMLAVQRKVDPGAVPGGPEGARPPAPDPHDRLTVRRVAT